METKVREISQFFEYKDQIVFCNICRNSFKLQDNKLFRAKRHAQGKNHLVKLKKQNYRTKIKAVMIGRETEGKTRPKIKPKVQKFQINLK